MGTSAWEINYLQSRSQWQTVSPSPDKMRYIREYASGKSLLDIGCSNGYYASYAQGLGFQVLGVDLEDYRRVKDSPFQVIKPGSLASLGNQKFDTVLLFDVLEHIYNDQGFAYEVLDRAQKRIIGSVPCVNDQCLHPYGLAFKHHIDKTHCREYSGDAVKNLFQAEGVKRIIVNHGGVVNPMVLQEFVRFPLLKPVVASLVKLFSLKEWFFTYHYADLYFVVFK